jgi:hypothetical protein
MNKQQLIQAIRSEALISDRPGQMVWLESIADQIESKWTEYPRDRGLGDFLDLGPELFAMADGSVLCWKGRNYVPQPAKPIEA